MKTQLLEDIGENATLPPTPPRPAGHSTRDNAAHKLAPARTAPPSPATPADEAAAPDLDRVFEEIAALEAQYQPPARQPDPAFEPTMPRDEPVLTPAEPTLAADPAPPAAAASARHDPLFDFTLPMPEQEASNPFTPPPGRRARPKRRYLLWAACALTGALLVRGGWWLYEERKDDGSLALVATLVRDAPRVDPKTQEPAAAPATPAAPAPPPLVMLEPDPPAAAAAEQPQQTVAQETPETEPVAEQETTAPPPKPAGRVTRRQPEAAPATPRVQREPARQIARAPAMQAHTSSDGEGATTALLRACRAHGYHAAQCIKQGCSITRYGFACRGR